MKTLKIIIWMLAALLVVNGCYYDEIATFEGLPQNVSFKNDVQPVFNANCITSGCHDAVPGHNPSLVFENSYDAILSGNYVNVTEPNKSLLYLELSSGSMPPSGALSINDQKIILAWITEGAKEN